MKSVPTPDARLYSEKNHESVWPAIDGRLMAMMTAML